MSIRTAEREAQEDPEYWKEKYEEACESDNAHRKRCEKLEKALKKIAEKAGYCIFGSSDTSHDHEVAYRQGSFQAFSDVAIIAKEALGRPSTTITEEKK